MIFLAVGKAQLFRRTRSHFAKNGPPMETLERVGPEVQARPGPGRPRPALTHQHAVRLSRWTSLSSNALPHLPMPGRSSLFEKHQPDSL